MEVDYAINPTRLYESVQTSDWTSASRAIRLYPNEAATWVRRRDKEGDMIWRFLPLHSALARNPPVEFVEALVKAYPAARGEKDLSGMLPVHYAAGNRCCVEIMRLLLDGCGGSVWEVDGNGMTPLHYVGAYGCGEGVLKLILGAAAEDRDVRKLVEIKNLEGMTPLMLAREGEYEGREDAVNTLEQCLNGQNFEKEAVNQVDLQVKTAESPRSDAISKSARNSYHCKSTGCDRTSASPVEITTTEDKEKHYLITPRNSGSDEFPIHMMDSRSPLNSLSTPPDEADRSNDAPGQRLYSISTRSIEGSKQSFAPHSTTSTMSNTKYFESPSAFNMKTPRSSGRGGKFKFDHPPPSPRYPPNLTSPRFALLSPRAHQTQTTHQTNSSDLMVEMQRLQLENQNLRARLSEYENQNDNPAHSTPASQQTVQATGARFKTLLTSLQQREHALTSIIQLAEQRENARLQSYTIRKQELLKLLAAEENEMKQENGYTYDGLTIGMAFGRELRALEEVRGEVGTMLNGLNSN